jgi:hypothetical protein
VLDTLICNRVASNLRNLSARACIQCTDLKTFSRNQEKQAQWERDNADAATKRANDAADYDTAKQKAKDDMEKTNNFNIKSSFLKDAGNAIATAMPEYNILIVTSQENDTWGTFSLSLYP